MFFNHMIENCEIFMNHLDLSFDTVVKFELICGSLYFEYFELILDELFRLEGKIKQKSEIPTKLLIFSVQSHLKVKNPPNQIISSKHFFLKMKKTSQNLKI